MQQDGCVAATAMVSADAGGSDATATAAKLGSAAMSNHGNDGGDAATAVAVVPLLQSLTSKDNSTRNVAEQAFNDLKDGHPEALIYGLLEVTVLPLFGVVCLVLCVSGWLLEGVSNLEPHFNESGLTSGCEGRTHRSRAQAGTARCTLKHLLAAWYLHPQR